MTERKNDTKDYLKPSERFVPEIKIPNVQEDITVEQLSLFENITLAHIDKNYMANAKVVNELIDRPITELAQVRQSLDVGQNVTVLVELDLEAGIELSSNHDFTYFDKAVFDAICTRSEAGDRTFTINTIYRTMHNYDSSRNPTDIRREEIMNSIRKMNQIKVSADMTDHVKSYLKKDKDYSHLSDDEIDRMVGFYKIGNEPLIDYRTVEAQIQGAKTEAIYLVREPFLYTYSKQIRHVMSVPSELLNLNLNMTVDRIAINSLLIKRIEKMKNQKEKSKHKQIAKRWRTIRFDGIYEAVAKVRGVEVADLSPKVKRTKRDDVKNILNSYKEKDYIIDYETTSDNRQAETKVILTI